MGKEAVGLLGRDEKSSPAGSGKKLKVGIFSFTGDEGCVIIFTEILNYKIAEWKNLIDFKVARVLQTRKELKDLDVAFVEGAISTYNEEKKLKEIRENSKKVVAIGSCAISGAPSNHRNFFDEEKWKEIEDVIKKFKHRPKVQPIGDFIKVDAQVPGCPIIEQKFVEVMDQYLKEFGIK